MLKKEKKREI